MNAKPVILHADDDPNDRVLVQIAIARAELSCDLRAVTDGEEAISYVKGRWPVLRTVSAIQCPIWSCWI